MADSSTIRVGVLGAKGRMGSTVVDAVNDAPDCDLSAALDVDDSIDALEEHGCQVVVDFTTPDAVMGNIKYAISRGIHCVVGTTGFDESRLEEIGRAHV